MKGKGRERSKMTMPLSTTTATPKSRGGSFLDLDDYGINCYGYSNKTRPWTGGGGLPDQIEASISV
jgi:hypothetical protein